MEKTGRSRSGDTRFGAEGPPACASAVLLAAGAGTRLGLGPKALLPYQGRSLAAALADTLRAAGCSPVVVVLGADAGRVAAEAGLGECLAEVNPEWERGMGSSFRRGIMRALAAAPTSPVLVALADQPGLTRELVQRLVQAHRPDPGPAGPAAGDSPKTVTAAAYRTAGGGLRRGHPVLFSPGAAAAAAETASGDAGARAWLRANSAAVRLVDCSDLGDGRDIDTPADLPLLDAPPPGSG